MMGMILQVPPFDDSVEEELTEGTGTTFLLEPLERKSLLDCGSAEEVEVS